MVYDEPYEREELEREIGTFEDTKIFLEQVLTGYFPFIEFFEQIANGELFCSTDEYNYRA